MTDKPDTSTAAVEKFIKESDAIAEMEGANFPKCTECEYLPLLRAVCADRDAKAARIAELEGAASIGLEEMERWEKMAECDCDLEYGDHVCGLPRLRKHIEEVRRALRRGEKKA